MSFRQVYVKKEVWPKVILKRLSVSLTHPFKCTRCKERFHKIHEANAHYLNTHQNSNDLLDKDIPENETKMEIEKFDGQIKNEMQTGIKEEVKFETEVQRGLKILEKIDVLKETSQETNKNQEAKSPHIKYMAKFEAKLKPGDLFRMTYFLGYNVQKQKIGRKKKTTHYYKELKCSGCDRIFRTRFGVQRHMETYHPDLESTSKASGVTRARNKRPTLAKKPFRKAKNKVANKKPWEEDDKNDSESDIEDKYEDMHLENSENKVVKGNLKFGEFDLLKIEEADIDFSEGEIETDYLVHAHSVIANE